nr:adenosine deaminase [Naumannella cuiyingiana]
MRAAPKVALHDHLDGGLRPGTVIELAAEVGHELPVGGDAEALGDWFFAAADSGSLVRYLETFEHTVAVTQTAQALRRVAREFVADQAADGVVYAEARWAPAQHTRGALSEEDAVIAVRDGLAEGMAAAAAGGSPIIARQLITGLRHHDDALSIAELAVAYRDDSVAGFDVAGPEDGFPPSRHSAAYELLNRAHARYTIHAGEAAGVDSIREAVRECGAQRIGHGVRIIEDIEVDGDELRLGEVASHLRDEQILLEVCPSSNLQTGIAATIAEHPVRTLDRAGLKITISCDNRLMSRTTLSREFALLADAFGYGLDDVERFTINGAEEAFLPEAERRALIDDVIIPGYAALR